MLLIFYKLGLGALGGSLIGAGGFLAGWLTRSGLFAAIIFGALATAFAPWYASLLILWLFGSSGAIHLLKKKRLLLTAADKAAKGQRRDFWQVTANLAPALAAASAYTLTHDPLFLLAMAAGFAEAVADTWGSELGVLSRRPPRSILTGRVLFPGISGGVSWLGSSASLLGAFLTSGLFFLCYSLISPFTWQLFWLLVGCGFGGSLIDSLLGAALQGKYRCTVCGTITEKALHHGQKTVLVSGIRLIGNDLVNFLSGGCTVFLTIIWLRLCR